ncbi:MAG TPA: alpha/beta hydrolase [Rhizomicrobium sp.]
MIPAAENFRPFFIDAGGVRLRAARFDADRPAAICLLLNGQTEFIEKYFEVIDELRGRGLSLVTFDWRGQGGSDRLLPDPRKAHITDFTDYDRDLEAVLRQTVLPLSAQHGLPVIAMAHSMGGEILIRRLHDVQTEFAAAILCAPMLRINPRGSPWWVVEKVSAYLNREGPSTEFVWGMAKRDQLTLPFSLQIVTSDPVRYARNQALLAANPELRLNGPTWGWLAAALRTIALTRSPGYAEAIQTPSLFFGAGRDRVCDTDAIRAFAQRVPMGTYVEIADAEHELLMERDVFRAQLWSHFDAFLGSHGLTKLP